MKISTNQVLDIISTWPASPIRYGTADCCQFAGFVIYQLSGLDVLRGVDYGCQEQADAMIDNAGNLGSLVTSVLEIEPVPVKYLQPGEPVLFSKFGVDAVCSVLSPTECVGLDRKGSIRRFPLNYCAYGWGVLCQA